MAGVKAAVTPPATMVGMGMGEQRRAAWPARLTGVLSGAACGMAVNALSDDFGYAGAAAAFGLAAVVSAVFWLRRLPAHAPLPRIVSRGLLAAAFAVTVVAVVRPGWAVVAAVLVVAAVALAADPETAFRLVAGVVPVAFGITLAGAGAEVTARGEVAPGVLVTALGVLIAGAGWYLGAVLQPTRETAAGLGLIGLVGGAGAAVDGLPLLGLAFACGGVALLVRHRAVRSGAAVVAGAALVAVGATGITGRGALPSAAFVVAGLATAAAGVVVALPARDRWQARWARLTGASR